MESGCLFYFKLVCVCVCVCACLQEGTDKWQVDGSLSPSAIRHCYIENKHGYRKLQYQKLTL